jgi:hypothetical protein
MAWNIAGGRESLMLFIYLFTLHSTELSTVQSKSIESMTRENVAGNDHDLM